MKKNIPKRSLTIDEDYEFQKTSWKVERIGWLGFFLFLGASFLGLTGAGPLNDAKAQQENIQVMYQPFARQLAPTEINVEVRSPHATFWIDHNFLSKYQVQQITPEPTEVMMNANKVFYQFKKQGKVPISVTFHLEPQQIGFINESIGENDKGIAINQFIYP